MANAGIHVVGAGGHGKVVVATLLEAGHAVAGVLDDNPQAWGRSILGIPVAGPVAQLAGKPGAEAILAVGDNPARRRIAESLPGVRWVVAVHPRAWVHASVRLGAGCLIAAGAVIQPDTVVGAHGIVNTGATVDHDCRLGDFVHVAPGVHVAGGVTIGSGALLGIGARVIPGATVGNDAVVGAGAVVIRPVPAGVTVVGVPARALEVRRG